MKIAVVPASFDPPTKGHEDIIRRAANLFEQVLVVVAVNTEKKAFLPADKRVELLQAICSDLPNVSVHQTDGLITDFMYKHRASVIVRGVRNGTDMDYEQSLEAVYKSQYPDAEVVILNARPGIGFISSSVVRAMYQMKGVYVEMVPFPVAAYLTDPNNPVNQG